MADSGFHISAKTLVNQRELREPSALKLTERHADFLHKIALNTLAFALSDE